MADNEQLDAKIAAVHEQLRLQEAELVDLLKQRAARPVDDVELSGPDGPVMLSALFGDHQDLMLSFNMGAGCNYCTLWADEMSGVYDHLQSRAAFVVISPDAPADQAAMKAKRGWAFPMVSHQGTSFAADMGFAEEKDGQPMWWPGVITFRKSDEGIRRVGSRFYGPGDPFCGVWHLFDLLEGGAGAWSPKKNYSSR